MQPLISSCLVVVFNFQDAAETLEFFFLISFISIALLKSVLNFFGIKDDCGCVFSEVSPSAC